jgi:hypothetical protein
MITKQLFYEQTEELRNDIATLLSDIRRARRENLLTSASNDDCEMSEDVYQDLEAYLIESRDCMFSAKECLI